MDKKINRKDWLDFSDQFSDENQGRPIKLERLDEVEGDEVLIINSPLFDLDFDHHGDGSIMIVTGEGTQTLTHTISNPATIWLDKDSNGKVLAMEILTNDNSKTILQFMDV
jgi:hypothetical protein